MQGTHIEVPDTLTDKDLHSFFREWEWPETPHPPVVIDLRKAKFLAPWALVLFSSYVLWQKEVKGKNARILINDTTYAGNYAESCGLSALIEGGQCLEAPPDGDSRTVPLARIKKSAEIAAFTSKVMRVLNIEDEEVEGAVKYSLVELLRNVVQHSRSEIGGIAMAQYHSNTGLVDVAVADCGLGIKNTLQEAYPEIDKDIKAIKFATQPHVSGTFGPSAYSTMRDNAGLGLFFIKEIASLSGGGFFLGSGDGLADIWGDPEGEQHKKYFEAQKGGWHGTFALLQLRKDTIAEFDSVLRICLAQAEQARKQPNELALDFLDELPDLKNIRIIHVIEFEEDVEKAAELRENIISPALAKEEMLVLDFKGIKFATQSFIHALIYRTLRDIQHVTLLIANCTNATKEAIMAVAAYAKTK
ncbi:MAG: STAS-like domain-containing protein [Gammaproteobacteria bacterium]|nr:STAS-like domain-containing protein [Gammaproteobacteria bacterium]